MDYYLKILSNNIDKSKKYVLEQIHILPDIYQDVIWRFHSDLCAFEFLPWDSYIYNSVDLEKDKSIKFYISKLDSLKYLYEGWIHLV